MLPICTLELHKNTQNLQTDRILLAVKTSLNRTVHSVKQSTVATGDCKSDATGNPGMQILQRKQSVVGRLWYVIRVPYVWRQAWMVNT